MPKREPKPFGVDRDYSAMGALDVEAQLLKGQEVKASLQGLVNDIRTEDLAKGGVKVEIAISGNIKLIVIPRFPVDRIRPGKTEEVSEPFIVRDITGEIEYEEEDSPTIVLTGQSDLPADGPGTSYRFDPLAGHDFIARAVDNNYQATGVRVTSGDKEPVLKLEIY